MPSTTRRPATKPGKPKPNPRIANIDDLEGIQDFDTQGGETSLMIDRKNRLFIVKERWKWPGANGPAELVARSRTPATIPESVEWMLRMHQAWDDGFIDSGSWHDMARWLKMVVAELRK